MFCDLDESSVLLAAVSKLCGSLRLVECIVSARKMSAVPAALKKTTKISRKRTNSATQVRNNPETAPKCFLVHFYKPVVPYGPFVDCPSVWL